MAGLSVESDTPRHASLMRLTKSDLADLVLDLESELDDSSFVGSVERSTQGLCDSVVDPSPHQLVLMASALKLARLLDESGEIDKSAATIQKQLLASCSELVASLDVEEAPAPLFAVPDVG